jgi:hypothetical protein
MTSLLHIKANPQTTSLEAIRDAELKLGFKIPNSLKDLLLVCNGGTLAVNGFSTRFEDGDTRRYALYRLNSLEEIIRGWGYVHDEPEVKESQILPFGDTLGNPAVCIGVGEQNYAKIYVLDWGLGAAFQAGSLEEFLGQLQYEADWQEFPPFKEWH